MLQIMCVFSMMLTVCGAVPVISKEVERRRDKSIILEIFVLARSPNI